MKYQYNDGGRKAAGYKGETGDCGARAIAIVTGMSYQAAYELVNHYGGMERKSKKRSHKTNARTGVHSATMRRIMESLGWKWHPTMLIGQGCKTHLRADELPTGRLLVNVSKHYTVVIDGVIHDNHDPSREGKRCVYGYFKETK